MTINELEQGLRNLIATQPVVTTGATGEVVTSVLSLIDAFRNLNFKTQTYPAQDVLKFNLLNESQKLENNFANWVCQVMQERGINLLLYIPRPQAQMGPMVNNYGMINGGQIDQSMMMGQMMYQSMPQQNMGMMNQMAGQPVQMMTQPNYNQMQPSMQMMSQPMATPRAPRKQATTFPGYQPTAMPTRIEPAVQTGMSKPQAAPASKVKSAPKANPAQTEIHKTAEEKQPAPEASNAPSPAEMLMGGFDADAAKGSGGKAAGRDYLMELLKK